MSKIIDSKETIWDTGWSEEEQENQFPQAKIDSLKTREGVETDGLLSREERNMDSLMSREERNLDSLMTR